MRVPGTHSTMKAGVAKLDITFDGHGTWATLLSDKVKRHIPPAYLAKTIEMSDPMYVRALVLDNGQQQIVLLTMDVTAIGARTISQNILDDSADDFMPRLRQRIETTFGIPGSHVSACASHSHQVPRMLCDDESQIDRALEAVDQARQSMVPVTIAVGSARENGLSFNRTLMMKDGTDFTVRSYHTPMPPDHEVEALRPIDPEIGVLRIDRLDGRALAIVYNFGVHLLLGAPTGEQGTITADHVGVTLRYLEECIGDEVMAFFLQGAVGDSCEVCTFDPEHPSSAQSYGTQLGQSVMRAWIDARPCSARLDVVTRQIDLPLRSDIPAVIAALKQEQAQLLASLQYTSLNFKSFLPLYLKYALSADFPSHWAFRYLHADNRGDLALRAMDERNRHAIDKYLDSIKTMERMAGNQEKIATLEKHQEVIEQLGTPVIAAEFKGIAIGDCIFVTAPMEILAETALTLKDKSPFEHTFIVSLSNGYLHYAPPASYYPRGGYEVTECLLAPAWQVTFEGVVDDLLSELCSSAATSAPVPEPVTISR